MPSSTTNPTNGSADGGGLFRTAVLTPNGFELRPMRRPAIGNGEVLVRTMACGVCSGDVFVYNNRVELAPTHSRLGHESSGMIEQVGASVTGYAAGDLVTSLGVPAYSDYLVTTPATLVKLPPGVDPTYALGEAVACCVHAMSRSGIRRGDRVALVGCGFMGLLCLQLAKHHGAAFVCAIDPLAHRLATSQGFGADATHSPSQASGAVLVQAHGHFDVVIEAAGTQGAVDLATELVAQHGRIVLVGYHQSNAGRRSVNMQQWNYKAIDVINGHVRRQAEKLDAMRHGVALLRDGQLSTEKLVTVYDFLEIEQAFRDLTSGGAPPFKAVLQMDPAR